MIERGGWAGEYNVTVCKGDGTETKLHIKNMITDAGLNFLRDGLAGKHSDLKIKYLALGDSSDSVQRNQTKLANERFRIAFAAQEDGGTGVLRSVCAIPDDEALFHIRELGIFAGKDADQNQNTGIMVSRILFDFDKSRESVPFTLRFERIDTIGRL
ncbi:hypothetical protein [Brevibacillus sp. JB24b]|uniref:hypothetical protein n=1 Tax=Brevibacillus sp. JB24b TaxID=3422308 RepID=UPI003F682D69